MCGIAVAIDLGGRGRAVSWATDRLRHRGPDGEGSLAERDGNIVLEHTRLAIIDPENPEANQPFEDPTGRWVIVYNGEIFNFRELRRNLERRGVVFRTRSDTEVVLLGFIDEGERMLERLRGMYAFVIWDRQTGDVFAARDHVGVKPLYYACSDDLFVASSEMRALLAYPGFEPRLDPARVVEFLAFGHNSWDGTLVERVYKLPPGHFLRIRAGRLTVREYWDAIPADGIAANPTSPTAELLELLDDAVGSAMVSDVPVGMMLSGGIDSSTIAALAARHADVAGLTAYSVDFGQPDDEARIAARFARELGLRHRLIRLTEAELTSDFDEWIRGIDYPSANPTWIAVSFIARAAREDGIKVLLSGDGGDELFGGYTRWMKYLRFHRHVWSRTPPRARRAAGKAVGRFARGLATDIARRAASQGELFVPSRPFHDDLLIRSLGPRSRAAAVASPPESIVDGLRAQFRARLPGADYLAWMSYVSLKTTLVEDFLQRLDKEGMRHSVEGRVPLLDPRLTAFALGLPQEIKVPRMRQKALFRSAVERLLPEYVRERPKQGFCPPTASWAEKLLRERLTLDGSLLVDQGLVARDAVEQVRAAGARGSFAVWTLGTLVEWTRENVSAVPSATRKVAAA